MILSNVLVLRKLRSGAMQTKRIGNVDTSRFFSWYRQLRTGLPRSQEESGKTYTNYGINAMVIFLDARGNTHILYNSYYDRIRETKVNRGGVGGIDR